MAAKKTEYIGAEEAGRRIGRSKRYTLTLLKAGRIRGADTLDNGTYIVQVRIGEAPEISPPLKKRHKP